ncbi:acyltransferase family protein [Vibrio sp. FNV 38]|nr:acyltransferase family protein [Vibrio sp. FNV 38]
MLTKNTSDLLYTVRALGIILVVVGHYLWHPNWTWSPYLFHMPLFFILGGVVAKPIQDTSAWCKKIMRHYVGYYVVWYVAIAAITWLIVSFWSTRIVFHLGTGIEVLSAPLRFNSHNNSLFMVGWFIVAYCMVSSLFSVYLTVFRRFSHSLKTLIFGLLIGYIGIEVLAPQFHVERYWVWNLASQWCVGWMYFSIGYVFNNMFEDVLERFKNVFWLIASWGLLATLVKLGLAHELGMSWSDYPDGYGLHLLISLLGIIGVFTVSHTLQHLKGIDHLVWIGRSSKPIMTLHMLCFVILDLTLVQFNILDSSTISALHHYVDPVFFWGYLVVGIYGPILTNRVLGLCLERLKRLYRASRERKSGGAATESPNSA